MIKLKRGFPPSFWTKKRVERWTKSWITKGNKSAKWQWPTYSGSGINTYAVDAMRPWHHGKCAFCEGRMLHPTIEHFRSKTRYPKSAFKWFNLFLSCGRCNSPRSTQYTYDACLKPDRDDPEAYFLINPITFKVDIQDQLSDVQKKIAENTIVRYDLNGDIAIALRKQYLADHHQYNGQPLPPATLEIMAQPDQPYSLMGKSMLKRRLVQP